MARKAAPRKKGIGRAAAIGLNKRQIVDAAIRLIDQNGLEEFSIRALARSLKVFPTALYWHIGGAKADLIADVSGRLLANLMRRDEIQPDWQDTLRLLFRRFRKRLHQHPNFAPAFGAQIRSNGAPNAPWVEIVLTALTTAGYSGKPLVDAFNALLGGVEGFITMELATMPPKGSDFVSDFQSGLRGLDAESYPLTVRHLPDMLNRSFVLRWKNGAHAPLDGGFEFLLEALLASIKAKAPQAIS